MIGLMDKLANWLAEALIAFVRASSVAATIMTVLAWSQLPGGSHRSPEKVFWIGASELGAWLAIWSLFAAPFAVLVTSVWGIPGRTIRWCVYLAAAALLISLLTPVL